MNIELDFFSILDILTISSGVMLGLLFLTSKRKNRRANIFLGLFLWSLTAEVFSTFSEMQDFEFEIFASGWLTLLLLFGYVLTTLNYRFRIWYTVLLLPFVFDIFDFGLPAILFYGISITLLFYTLHLMRQNEAKLCDFYSDLDNKTLSWMKAIIYVFLFFNILWIVEDLLPANFEFAIEVFSTVSAILTASVIFWIGHNGFNQPEIFNQVIHSDKESNVLNINKEAPLMEEYTQESTEEGHESIVESKEEIEPIVPEVEEESQLKTIDIFNQLTNKIKEEKLFLQKDVTIRLLARQLKINEKEFSKLIKTHTGKNFYHYINQFRVNEFKRLLQTPKATKLSLLGLSEESGFCSKSTFYSTFKAFEGITPKQYQDQLKKSE